MCRGNCASVCIRDEPERIVTLQLLINRSAGLSCSFLGGVLRQVARQLSKPLVPSRGFSVCHPASFSGSCVFRDCRSPPGVVVGVLVAGLGQRRCLSGRMSASVACPLHLRITMPGPMSSSTVQTCRHKSAAGRAAAVHQTGPLLQPLTTEALSIHTVRGGIASCNIFSSPHSSARSDVG